MRNEEKEEFDYRFDLIDLNKKKKLMLRRPYLLELKTGKKYIVALIIYIENEEQNTITCNFQETIQFKEELSLFFNGDSQNQYLQPAKRKVNDEELKSLKLKNNKNLNIYFSQAESKAIAKLIDYSILGFSLTKIYDKEKTKYFETEVPYIIVKDYVKSM
jgi:hypothetical protein